MKIDYVWQPKPLFVQALFFGFGLVLSFEQGYFFRFSFRLFECLARYVSEPALRN